MTSPGVLDRVSLDPGLVLRTGGGLVALVASQVVGHPWGVRADLLVLVVALALVPVDLLPAFAVVLVRQRDGVLGPLSFSDLVALSYVARVALSNRVLRLRLTPSRVALGLFVLWSTLVTVTGHGLLPPLGRLGLYVALGIALTYRPGARRWLEVGVVALAVLEVVWYLPSFPARFFGVLVADPAHMGLLLVCAVLIVAAWPWPPLPKLVVCGLLALGVVATMTRSIWFGAACVLVAAALPRRWYLPLALPPLLAAALLPLDSWIGDLFHLNPYSGALRLASIQAGLREFRLHPFTGEGWASGSAARLYGIPDVLRAPVYNAWIFIAVSAGTVGVALFLVFVALRAREAVADRTAYLCLVCVLGMSLTEMPFYGGSLIAVLFFCLTEKRP